MASEEQPLLGRSVSPSPNIRNSDGKTPATQRRGMSTPCTPESRRRKHDAHTWTEKISMSLENLRKAFRKAGSEERDKVRIGRNIFSLVYYDSFFHWIFPSWRSEVCKLYSDWLSCCR